MHNLEASCVQFARLLGFHFVRLLPCALSLSISLFYVRPFTCSVSACIYFFVRIAHMCTAHLLKVVNTSKRDLNYLFVCCFYLYFFSAHFRIWQLDTYTSISCSHSVSCSFPSLPSISEYANTPVHNEFRRQELFECKLISFLSVSFISNVGSVNWKIASLTLCLNDRKGKVITFT